MKYGYFDDKNREYVITTPETPYPWINYLGNDHFHSIISNTAGGYSFYKDPRLRRITRYRYNNVPLDSGGKYFYIRENDLGIWSPGWKPAKTRLDFYECRHGLNYTQIKSELNGLGCEVFIWFLSVWKQKSRECASPTIPERSGILNFFRLWNGACGTHRMI